MNVVSKETQILEPSDDLGIVSDLTSELSRLGYSERVKNVVLETFGVFHKEICTREPVDEDGASFLLCESSRAIYGDYPKDEDLQLAMWFLFFIGFRGPFGKWNEQATLGLKGGLTTWTQGFQSYLKQAWVTPYKAIDWARVLPRIWLDHFAFPHLVYYFMRPLMALETVIALNRLEVPFWKQGTSFSDADKGLRLAEIEWWIDLESQVALDQGTLPEDGGVLGQLLDSFRNYDGKTFVARGLNLLKLPFFQMAFCGESEWRKREVYAPVLQKWASLAMERAGSVEDKAGCYRIAWLAYSYSLEYASIEEGEGQLLVAAAREFLGRLRSSIRGNPDKADYETFNDASLFLFYFAEPWTLAKPLLLIFAELPRPVLADDLRNWNEPGKTQFPDHPEGRIVQNIINALVSPLSPGVQAELKDDPKMSALRSKFAAFCLERLKTKENVDKDKAVTAADLVEPRIWWRRCYVRAFAELHCSPQGKGHRVLHWLQEKDPDEIVRRFAKETYRRARQQADLPQEKSPRRAILSAFWWLQQAHLLELNVKIDPEGAQRTRAKQLRRYADKPIN